MLRMDFYFFILPSANSGQGRKTCLDCSVDVMASCKNMASGIRNRPWLLSSHDNLTEGWSMDFNSDAQFDWQKIILIQANGRLKLDSH